MGVVREVLGVVKKESCWERGRGISPTFILGLYAPREAYHVTCQACDKLLEVV